MSVGAERFTESFSGRSKRHPKRTRYDGSRGRVVMRSAISRVAVAAMVALALGLASACGSSSSSSTGPIKIGFLYPFQGPYAIYGTWAKAGLDLRLKQASNKFEGRQIQLSTADEDPNNPATTLQSLKTLVEQDGDTVVIGPAFSSSEEAVAAYAKQANITLLTLLTCPWDIAANKHFLCWPGTDVASTRLVGDYAYQVLGYKTIDTIAPDYVAGHDYIGGAASEFESLGGSITQQQWVPLTTTDVGPYVSNLNPNADALVMWLLPGTAEAFLQQVKASGNKIPIILEFDLQDPFNQQLGPVLNGTIGSNFWEPTVQNTETTQFNAAFTAAYPTQGQPNATQMAAWAMADGLLDVLKTTDGDTSYVKLHPAFLNLKWNTPEGPSCFSENGMALTGQFITQMAINSSGQYYWKVLKSYSYQSDPHDTGKCNGS